jgi:hypothetical protein
VSSAAEPNATGGTPEAENYTLTMTTNLTHENSFIKIITK